MTEEESVEEVEARYKANLERKNAAMEAAEAAEKKAAEDAQAVADAKEAKELRMAEMQEAVAEALGVVKTPEPVDLAAGKKPEHDPVIQLQGKDSKNASPYGDPRTAKEIQWMNAFLKVNNYDKVEYGSLAFLHGTARAAEYAFTDSDSDCGDDVSAWRPADVWCNAIWYAAQCGRQLSGVVTYRACDINAGDGLSVQIRTIASQTDMAALGACECAVCASDTFSTHTLTLHRYDIYKVACNLDLFSIGPILKEGMIQVMADDFVRGIDAAIWTEMLALTNCGGAPGWTETLGSDVVCDPNAVTSENCCSYAANLYKEIVQLEANMRAGGYGKSGFTLVLHPTVATYLKYKEGISVPYWVNNISMSGNKLAKIGDIDVIEYCGAQVCTDAELTIAVLLDKTRAIGEAYGKKPFLKIDEDPIECDSWKYVMRCYIAIQCLDYKAIGHIKNPA